VSVGLRIGVAGAAPLASLWALVLRDYGQHRVIGLGLGGSKLSDPEAIKRWEFARVANAPNLLTLVRHVDVIYLFGYTRWTAVNACSAELGVNPVLILPKWAPLAQLRRFAQSPDRVCALANNPLEPTTSIDRLASPDEIWIMADQARTFEVVEQVWRPIINTVPVTRVVFPNGSETPLAWLPPAAGTSPGVSGPLPPLKVTERFADVSDS